VQADDNESSGYMKGGVSSKQPCLPPEVTSRSRDVNKDGGGVNDHPTP